jgi:hypothetical protein
VILDYPQGTLYLQPNRHFTEPDAWFQLGSAFSVCMSVALRGSG